MGPYIFKCLEQFNLLLPYISHEGESSKSFCTRKNLKYFLAIYVNGLIFTPLRVKNLYWWNFFYTESDFILPNTRYIDEIIMTSRESAKIAYTFWANGNLSRRKISFINFPYLKGAHFHSLAYSKCERPLDYRVLKIKYKISWLFYYIIAVL
jgi:hypothetical protein